MFKKILIANFFLLGFAIKLFAGPVEATNRQYTIEEIALAFQEAQSDRFISGNVKTLKLTSFQDAILEGTRGGVRDGISKGMHQPIAALLQKIFSSICKPVDTSLSIRRSIFLTLNSAVLSFPKLAQWSFRINNVVNTHMLKPATSSNKVLRRAILSDVDSDGQDSQVDQDYAFGIKLVTDQLDYIKKSIEFSINAYEKRPFSMKIFRPYDASDLQEIIFVSKQLVFQLDYLIQVSSQIKNLAQLTDAKDLIQRSLDSINSQIKDLSSLVDPDQTFDQQRKGLKLNIDTGARSARANNGLGASLDAAI